MTEPALREDGTVARLVVAAETCYPATVGSARVRVLSMRSALAEHGVDLTYLPSLTSAEYRVVTSSAPSPVKALTLSRAAVRLAGRRPPRGGLRLRPPPALPA